jgi:class 3 adenylate cyclase
LGGIPPFGDRDANGKNAQKADVAGGRGDISNRPAAALGAKASDFETRKLAAILAVDIVGFSRLTGGDEDRTLASQPRC